MADTDTRWHSMRGGITRYDREDYGNVTVFSLLVSTPVGGPFGQRVEVDTKRLEDSPGLYKRVLDLLVRDLTARVG